MEVSATKSRVRGNVIGGHRHRRLMGIGAGLLGAALLCVVLAPAALAANQIYWGNANPAANNISFANLDGTGSGGNLNITGATPSAPRGVAIDPVANKVFWANANGNTISFANLDNTGGGGQLNITGATASTPIGVAVDPAENRVFWANFGDNTHPISFANEDNTGGGGNLNVTGATASNAEGVAVDPASNKLFWANTGNDTISFANLNNTGGGSQLNITGATAAGPVGVTVDTASNRIFWPNAGNNTISYAFEDNTGGGGQLNIAGATANNPRGIAVDPDANKIYWTNTGNSTISFANENNTGSGGQLPLTGATTNETTFPALLRTPQGTGLPSVTGGSVVGSTLSCSPATWASNLLGSFLYRAPRTIITSWTKDGAAFDGNSSSITAALPGTYTCTNTALNQAGTTNQQSAAFVVRGCVVPKIRGKRLRRARKILPRSDCRLGKVRGPKRGSAKVKRQRPAPGSIRPPGFKVSVKTK